MNSMNCFVNWDPVNTHDRLNKTQPCLKGKIASQCDALFNKLSLGVSLAKRHERVSQPHERLMYQHDFESCKRTIKSSKLWIRISPQHVWGNGCLAPVWSKMAPKNGSCVQDVTDTAITDQCRSLLICSALRPQQAVAVSIVWICILVVLCTFYSKFCTAWRNSIAQIRAMAEQLRSRQKLGSPIQNNPKTTKWGSQVMAQQPPLCESIKSWSYLTKLTHFKNPC